MKVVCYSQPWIIHRDLLKPVTILKATLEEALAHLIKPRKGSTTFKPDLSLRHIKPPLFQQSVDSSGNCCLSRSYYNMVWLSSYPVECAGVR